MKDQDNLMELFHSNQGRLTIQDAYYQADTGYNRENNLFYVYLFYQNNKIIYVHYGLRGTEKVHYTKDSPIKQFRAMCKSGEINNVNHYKLTRFSAEADCLFYVDFLIKKFSPVYNKKILVPDETYYNKQTRFIHTNESVNTCTNFLHISLNSGVPIKLIHKEFEIPIVALESIKNNTTYCLPCQYVDKRGDVKTDKYLFKFYSDVIFKTMIEYFISMDSIIYH